MTERKPNVDWEAVEREYRAGQLSIREIARTHGITDGAIRQKAAKLKWTRALVAKVRSAISDRLLRDAATHTQRASDAEVVEAAATRGIEVVTSHRRDLEQLHKLKRILATRLSAFLHGEDVDGPCMGEKESPGDLLEKLARVTSRLVPLERQAYSLDEGADDAAARIVLGRPLTAEEWAAQHGGDA